MGKLCLVYQKDHLKALLKGLLYLLLQSKRKIKSLIEVQWNKYRCLIGSVMDSENERKQNSIRTNKTKIFEALLYSIFLYNSNVKW